MVGLLTYGYKRFAAEDGAMRQALPPLYAATQALLPLVDADTSAFAEFSVSGALPTAAAVTTPTATGCPQTASRHRRREGKVSAFLCSAQSASCVCWQEDSGLGCGAQESH